MIYFKYFLYGNFLMKINYSPENIGRMFNFSQKIMTIFVVNLNSQYDNLHDGQS